MMASNIITNSPNISAEKKIETVDGRDIYSLQVDDSESNVVVMLQTLLPKSSGYGDIAFYISVIYPKAPHHTNFWVTRAGFEGILNDSGVANRALREKVRNFLEAYDRGDPISNLLQEVRDNL